MTHKRIIDDDTQSSSSPRKRFRHDASSFPHTPASSTRATSPSRRSCATPVTPYTPYPLHASDSPSNPFGRKRRERLAHTLPPATPFGKHLALRFQFVRRGITPRMGGVYRTVRVPTNYTFVHLRALIAWLFDTPARYANGKAGDDDYLFEVKAKASMYSPLYKPGQIKAGVTTVKVSNMQDPARWQSGYGLDVEEDELLSQEAGEEADERASEVEDLMQEDWDWDDEEDFTLGHAWPMGLDPTIGIVYHHSTETQVHITLNATKLPRQRGSSNTPHVFNARGRVHLSPPPLPRPLFTRSVLDTLSSSPAAPLDFGLRKRLMAQMLPPVQPILKPNTRQTHDEDLTDTDADGELDQDVHAFTSDHPFFASPSKKPQREPTIILVEDSDEEEAEEDGSEDYDAQPKLSRWNEPAYAFALYLLQFMDPLGIPYDDVDASFFQEQKAYDPFENDDDLVKAVKLAPAEAEEVYEEDGDEYDEEEEEPEVIDLADSEKDDEAGEDAEYDEEEIAEEDEEDEEDFFDPHKFTLGSTPDLTHRASSSLPASSPPRDSSPAPLPFASEASIILEEHYPNTKYSHTPAPPRARTHRLRIGRIERRMARTKRAEFLTKYDEVDEEEDAADQLVDDEPAEEVWTKPVLKEGEIWDPFGDEVEI